MKNEKEFDRSKCFMFFESYLEAAEKYQVQFNTEVAFNFLIGLARYALYQEESKDGVTNALVSALKNAIDSGQEKRSKGFAGENFEMTRLVAEYMRDHPDASQRTIVSATGVSKTKVGKVQKNIRQSELSITEYLNNIVYPNLNNNSNFNINNNINNNSETATETSHELTTEPATPKKDNSPSEKPVKEKGYNDFSWEDKMMIYRLHAYEDYSFEEIGKKIDIDTEIVKKLFIEYEADIPFN